MLAVNNLRYEYPGVTALADIQFQIPPQSIVAVVGPNGAGKTTLFRCLACLEAPFSGEVRIDGILSTEDPRKCHRLIGFLPDMFGLFEELTVEQSLRYFAQAAKTPEPQSLALQVAQRIGLAHKLSARVSELSRGMRQRLGIGQLLVKSPRILILDEPAAGLDPDARAELSVLLRSLRDQGLTLVVSSHILTELQEYADRMIVLENGKILSDVGTGAGQSTRTAALHLEVETSVERASDLAKHLQSLECTVLLQDQGTLRARTPWTREQARQIMHDLIVDNQYPLYQFQIRELDLQEEYRHALRK